MIYTILAAEELCKLGYKKSIRTVENFGQLEISPGYTVLNCLTDRNFAPNHREHRILFLSRITSSPYLEREKVSEDTEYTYEGDSALGLGIGCLLSTVTLSLGGDQRFRNFSLKLTKKILVEDEIQEELCEAYTVANQEMVSENNTFLKEKLLNTLKCGEDIVERANRYFSNLIFCKKALAQIKALTGRELFFKKIVEHLNVFNTDIGLGKTQFRPDGIEYAAVESVSTMNKHKQSRIFECPDGAYRIFEAHSKLKGANQRIHIFPDLEKKQVLIGYVGEHLPLA